MPSEVLEARGDKRVLVEMMLENDFRDGFGKAVDLSRRMHVQCIAVIPPKGTDIRNSHIPPNQNDMRSIASITKLYAVGRFLMKR